ncbi:MAG: 50S ribosomal protein L30 [Candidatus Hodarchaeales archaeon]
MSAQSERKYLAVVRVRGRHNIHHKISDTIEMLNLLKPNHCVVIENKPTYLGMLQKARNYLTWGEIDHDTFKYLIKKRGRLSGNKKITEEYISQNTGFKDIDDFVDRFFKHDAKLSDLNLKKFFRLKPPSKGYERKGVKTAYREGGALGYRGEEINKLLNGMI